MTICVGVKPDVFATPSPAELELLASVLPELILLMQQEIVDED